MALELDIESIRAGDKAAFESAYHGLKVPIYTLALRTLGSRTAAEDVTQETFLRLYTVPPGPEVRNPKAWLFLRRACFRYGDFTAGGLPPVQKSKIAPSSGLDRRILAEIDKI